MNKVRVLIMTNSSTFTARLVREIKDPAIEVVGSAFTAINIAANAQTNKADVLLLDARVPRLDLVDMSKKLAGLPTRTAIVIMHAPNDTKAPQYRAIVAGVVKLPVQETPLAYQTFFKDLYFQIKLASTAKTGRLGGMIKTAYRWRPGMPFSTRFTGVIALGASAGGTEATQEVLKDLPANMPGIVITQHMPPMFTNVYAQRLNNICQMNVREAKDHDAIEQGTVLIAPGGFQMRVQKIAPGPKGTIVRCAGEDRVSGHCPSVDVLFDSVARTVGGNSIGIILTGMGADGAVGLLKMRQLGSFTIGQDEKTSMVYGMPGVAYQKGAVALQLPLNEIAPALVSRLISM